MKVLNFGSLNIDYVYQLDHFVRAGETTASTGYAKNVGGKGLNQSIALARAGAEVYHAGSIGEDGRFLAEYLAENGVNTDHIAVIDSVSGHAIIQVDANGQNCIILHGGANQSITREQIDRTLEAFSAGDILLLQNEINNLPYLMEKAAEKGMQIALNPSPISPALAEMPLEKVTYFLVNEIEGEELSGKSEPDDIAAELLTRYPDSRIVLTLGKRGCMYADVTQRFLAETYPGKPVDTTAAGDTFTGYFLSFILNGASPREAVDLANAAATIAVTRHGAACSIPVREEALALQAEYRHS